MNFNIIFDDLNISYYVPAPERVKDSNFKNKNDHIEFDEIDNILYKSAIIRYTTDGSEPNKDSRIYTEPICVPGNTIVKAKTFMPSGGASLTVKLDKKVFRITQLTNSLWTDYQTDFVFFVVM